MAVLLALVTDLACRTVIVYLIWPQRDHICLESGDLYNPQNLERWVALKIQYAEYHSQESG